MISRIRKTWNEQPLTLILGLAILLRLIAAIFAKGWGMFDDHFMIIESAQSWADGFDATYWLPWSPVNQGPTGHLMFYPGFHFVLFTLLEWLSVTDPQVKMFIVRLLHAAFSLLTIVYAFRIVEKLDGLKSARLTGLLLAVLWFMPWMSVRNLVESTSIPLLILGFWQMIRKENLRDPFWTFFAAGIFFGLAIDIRLQTGLFLMGAGAVVLFQRKWIALLGLIAGSFTSVFLILGTIDIFLWGVPFSEIHGYISVNIAERGDYVTLPWYNYFLTIWGVLIPPISLFLFFGFLRTWRRYTLLFVPALLFLIFHSYFPNKQERFILPLIPFIVILGVMGWNQFVAKSGFWSKHKNLLRGCWIFFWIINLLFLPVITVNYSKRARVETMCYLSRYPDIKQLLVADDDNRPELFPRFYLQQWPYIYAEFLSNENTEQLILRAASSSKEKQPRLILFTGEKNLQERIIKTRESFPYIVYETTIEPGFIDWLVHWLNPINQNNRVFIYRNCEFFPERIE